LRLSPELYAALEAWAQQEMRSVNSQIEYILREAVRRRQRSLEIPLASSAEPTTDIKDVSSTESPPSAAEGASACNLGQPTGPGKDDAATSSPPHSPSC
ncbi:MAG: hypothetical protein NZ602_00600, partial [Thermoguttaceae bacterium]|nr:hypothetical protein [Thermoguttaceae bacterium]MDW8036910.1 hypothetical protein [Thermoguttaceae bacterium]